MKKSIAAVSSLMLGASPAFAQNIEIRPNASTPSVVGVPDNFTGHAIIDALFPATAQTRATMGEVTFAPGARTVWHTHPIGQLLIITSGKGWVQEDGQPRREVNSGDVVWIAPGIKHWHGATDTNGMRHIAVTYMLDGKNVEWLEPVSDEQYRVR
jgi:quercetin dioxygenase-like cupin family protein